MKRCLYLCNSMSPFSRKKVYGGKIHSYDLFDKIAEFSKDGLFIVAMTPTIK